MSVRRNTPVESDAPEAARCVFVYPHAGRWRVVVDGVTVFAVNEDIALELADHMAELEQVAVVATAPR